MKLIVLLSFFVCRFSFGQDFQKLFEQKVIELHDSENRFNACKDTLENQKILYDSNIEDLKKVIAELNSKLNDETDKNESLRGDKIIVENNLFRDQIDSLNHVINEKDSTSKAINNKISQLVVQEKNNVANAISEGKAMVYRNILDYYASTSFNFLTLNASFSMTMRDIEILRSEPDVSEILYDLNLYFELKSVLDKRFSESVIQSALLKFERFKFQDPLIEALKSTIKDYYIYNDELNLLISKIIEMDEEKSGDNDKDMHREKFKLILLEVSDFIYNYPSYYKYPYVNKIIMEIINRKRENSDVVISDLLTK